MPSLTHSLRISVCSSSVVSRVRAGSVIAATVRSAPGRADVVACLVIGWSAHYTSAMFASSGVTAALITVAAGLLGVVVSTKPSQQVMPIRVRVRRRGSRRS